jgi:hypothetical protein
MQRNGSPNEVHTCLSIPAAIILTTSLRRSDLELPFIVW